MRTRFTPGRRPRFVNVFGRPLAFRVDCDGEADAHRRMDYVELRLMARRFDVVRSTDLLVAVSPGLPWVGKDPVRFLRRIAVRRDGAALMVEVAWRTGAAVRSMVMYAVAVSVAWALARGCGAADVRGGLLVILGAALVVAYLESRMAARGVHSLQDVCRGEDTGEGPFGW